MAMRTVCFVFLWLIISFGTVFKIFITLSHRLSRLGFMSPAHSPYNPLSASASASASASTPIPTSDSDSNGEYVDDLDEEEEEDEETARKALSMMLERYGDGVV